MSDPEPRFGFFVIQTRTERRGTGLAVSGVLENLGTGEKRTFQSSEHLTQLLQEWGAGTATIDFAYAPPGREVPS